jgi:uncharacterized protein YqgQ
MYKSFEDIQTIFKEYGKLEYIDSVIKDGIKYTLIKYEITDMIHMGGVCSKIIYQGMDITNDIDAYTNTTFISELKELFKSDIPLVSIGHKMDMRIVTMTRYNIVVEFKDQICFRHIDHLSKK